MESIFCLHSVTLSTNLPFQNHTRLVSFPRHPVGHLSFPRWVRASLHHRVFFSSHVPPPPPPPPPQQSAPKSDDIVDSQKGRRGGWKGPRAAAAGAAMIVACALGAVYMSRGPPASAASHSGTAVSSDPETVQNKIRREVYEILFEKDRCTINRGQTKSIDVICNNWFADHQKYEAAFPVIEILIARRYYLEAKAVCMKIKGSKLNSDENRDARIPLLMAVIDMMLAVQTMLLPESSIGDVNKLIETATKSWTDYHKLLAGGFVNLPVETL